MKIALLGDIVLIGKYNLLINSCAKSTLKNISEFLKQYDYVKGDLESPLTNRTKSIYSLHDISNLEKYLIKGKSCYFIDINNQESLLKKNGKYTYDRYKFNKYNKKILS